MSIKWYTPKMSLEGYTRKWKQKLPGAGNQLARKRCRKGTCHWVHFYIYLFLAICFITYLNNENIFNWGAAGGSWWWSQWVSSLLLAPKPLSTADPHSNQNLCFCQHLGPWVSASRWGKSLYGPLRTASKHLAYRMAHMFVYLNKHYRSQ